jgi:hypothetical protein
VGRAFSPCDAQKILKNWAPKHGFGLESLIKNKFFIYINKKTKGKAFFKILTSLHYKKQRISPLSIAKIVKLYYTEKVRTCFKKTGFNIFWLTF